MLRSDQVEAPGRWSVVGGFYARPELRQEIGLSSLDKKWQHLNQLFNQTRSRSINSEPENLIKTMGVGF